MLDPELVGYLDQRFAALTDLFARQSERSEQRFETIDQRFEKIDQRFEKTDQAIREVHILFEDLDTRLRLVAESVAFFSDALREFRVDVDRQFAEVKAVNRLSYVEIERRLATLGV
jgi:hypothetical protein